MRALRRAWIVAGTSIASRSEADTQDSCSRSNRPLVYEHPQHLAEEQGIALAGAQDALTQLRR